MSVWHLVGTAGIWLAIGLGVGGCRDERPKTMCAGIQNEARINLRAVFICQTAFKQKTGHFSSSLVEIGYTPTTPIYYDVEIDSASEDTFTSKATGKKVAAGDVWSGNESGAVFVNEDKLGTGPRYCYEDGQRSDD